MSVRAMTKVTVAITRHEVCTYEFEGIVDECAVHELIGSAEYDPVDSNIRSEDVDVLEVKVLDRDAGAVEVGE